MKELYSDIEVCPWCGVKPSICISQHKKTVMFDIMVGCTNEDCRFNPKCYSTSTCNGLDGFINDMIAEWNSRCGKKIPNPPNIEFVADTESKWTLSEFSKTSEEANGDENICDIGCIWCKHHFLDDNDYLWCRRYGERTESAIKKCSREYFTDETEENKCADCKHYWYCAGEECCNLEEPSFPESCDKFEQEDSK